MPALFFNLAFIAELTHGLYESRIQSKMIDTALQAVENVIKRDMSKKHVFTEAANQHTHKLAELREGGKSDKEGESGGDSGGEASAEAD